MSKKYKNEPYEKVSELLGYKINTLKTWRSTHKLPDYDGIDIFDENNMIDMRKVEALLAKLDEVKKLGYKYGVKEAAKKCDLSVGFFAVKADRLRCGICHPIKAAEHLYCDADIQKLKRLPTHRRNQRDRVRGRRRQGELHGELSYDGCLPLGDGFEKFWMGIGRVERYLRCAPADRQFF